MGAWAAIYQADKIKTVPGSRRGNKTLRVIYCRGQETGRVYLPAQVPDDIHYARRVLTPSDNETDRPRRAEPQGPSGGY